jgi:hypothetical protein
LRDKRREKKKWRRKEEKMEGWDERGRLNYKAEQLKLFYYGSMG